MLQRKTNAVLLNTAKERQRTTEDLLNTVKYDKGLQIDLLNTAKNDKGLGIIPQQRKTKDLESYHNKEGQRTLN